MKKHQKQILALALILVFTACAVLLTKLSTAGKPEKPDPCETIVTSLEEIHSKLDVIDEKVSPITCDGTLSEGGRWCDNYDGTIKDMTTGLIWLQDAFCMRTTWYDAIRAVAEDLRSGDCGLTDGSIWGDWRLPTANELLE